jgi:hypothetical protein
LEKRGLAANAVDKVISLKIAEENAHTVVREVITPTNAENAFVPKRKIRQVNLLTKRRNVLLYLQLGRRKILASRRLSLKWKNLTRLMRMRRNRLEHWQAMTSQSNMPTWSINRQHSSLRSFNE